MKKESPYSELGTKIFKGIQLAFQKLIEETKKNKETLVFSKNGKIVYYSPK
jgi:hypothetical protein